MRDAVLTAVYSPEAEEFSLFSNEEQLVFGKTGAAWLA